MKTSNPVSSNHRRTLSVTARTIEKSLDELENIILQAGKQKLTYTVRSSYSSDQRQNILGTIAELKDANEEMVKSLGLQRELKDENQILRATATHLWTILIDSTSHGMRGYGMLPQEAAREIDVHVKKLLKILQKLM